MRLRKSYSMISYLYKNLLPRHLSDILRSREVENKTPPNFCKLSTILDFRKEMKNRKVYPKMGFFLSFMAFLLIEQTVGGNFASEEDPYIEGGKTIIVNWMCVSFNFWENQIPSSQKALTGITSQSKSFHGRKRVNILIVLFLLQYESRPGHKMPHIRHI